MDFGEDQPAVVPRAVGGRILMNATFAFVQAFRAMIVVSDVRGVQAIKHMPEWIVPSESSKLGEQAV